jgi:hypothetical protein
MPKSIAGIVAIGCLLPALLQAADSLEDAFREISEQLIAQLPERQKPLVIAIAPIQHNVDRCSEFSFDALEEFSVHFIGGKKLELVERYRLVSILEEHEISNFNIFNPKDQKRLGQLATINAIVIASISDRGQMFRLVAGITEIEKGKTLAKASTKFPASIDVKNLMKHKRDCTYVKVFTPPSSDNNDPATQIKLGAPYFDSGWFFMSSQAGVKSYKEITHDLGDYPSRVKVLVKAIDGANEGFIFEGSGVQHEDDDRDNGYYGGVIFAYDQTRVRIWAPSKNNSFGHGRIIAIGDGWGGEVNSQYSQTAQVKVLVWR